MHELNLMDTALHDSSTQSKVSRYFITLFFFLCSFFVCLCLHVTMKKRFDSHKHISLFGTFARIDRLDSIFENIKIFRGNQIPAGITCH
jgi:hypothetical protein